MTIFFTIELYIIDCSKLSLYPYVLDTFKTKIHGAFLSIFTNGLSPTYATDSTGDLYYNFL